MSLAAGLDLSSSSQDVSVWMVKQANEITEVKPAAANNITPAGAVPLSQVPLTGESRERLGRSFDAAAQLNLGVGKGTGTLPVYIKPSGAAGTRPEAAALLESLFGKEAVVAGTSVTYSLRSPDDPQLFYTLWRLLGTTLQRAVGAYVTACTFRIGATRDAEGFVFGDFTLGHYSQLKTPLDSLRAAVIAAGDDPTFGVNQVGEFAVGQYLTLGDEDNSDAGFRVTAVDAAMRQITVEGTVNAEVPVNSLIRPWTPDTRRLGDELSGRIGTTNWGTDFTNLKIISAEIPVDLQVADIPGQQGDGQYVRGLQYGRRAISWSMSLVHTPEYEALRSHIIPETENDLAMTVGNAAGKRMTFTLKNAKILTLEEVEGEPLQMRLTGTARPSAARNDVLQLAFT